MAPEILVDTVPKDHVLKAQSGTQSRSGGIERKTRSEHSSVHQGQLLPQGALSARGGALPTHWGKRTKEGRKFVSGSP